MIRVRSFVLGLAAAVAWSGVSVAAPASTSAPSLDDNPFIQLYRLRVSQAELNLERQKALEQLAHARLARGKKLMGSSAISAEEFDVMTSEASVTTSERELAAKKIDEAQTYLRIVEAQVKRGLAIPLCTYETE